MFDKVVIDMLLQGILESLFMVVFSTLFAYLIGLPLGIVLVVTDNEGIRPCGWLNSVLNVIVNLTRSVPFLILAVAIIPFTPFCCGNLYRSESDGCFPGDCRGSFCRPAGGRFYSRSG